MAVNEQANVKVTLNNEEAKRELDQLNDRIRKLIELKKKAEAEGDVKGFKKIDAELKQANREAKKYEKQMYDIDAALKNINGASWNELKRAEAALVQQTKGLNRETKEFVSKSAQLKLVRNEIREINAQQRASQSMWGRMADGFNRYFGMATAWLASIAGVTIKARQAVDSFMDREDMLGKVKALTKLSGQELDFLEQKAVEFATTTSKEGIKIQKSADEILEAFQLVGSAKPELLKNKEALAEVTREVLILSEAAEGMPLADAIDATTKAMNQYSAGADQAARFTNAMAAGAQLGAVQIPQVGESIKEFGTNAAAANIPIEQSVALIEILGEKAGVVGPRAGIQLRNFFTILSAGAKDTNPEIVGLETALDNLQKKNLSSAEYVQLFGRENANVARILVQNRQYVDELTDALTGTDTAYKQAIDNTSDQKAQLNQAKNRAKEYAIELGERLAPAMTGLVSKGGMILKFLSASVKLFYQTRGVLIPLAAGIGAYTLAIKANIIWQKIYDTAVKISTASTKAFNTALKGSPWGLIAGLVAAAGAAYLSYKSSVSEAKDGQKDFNDELQRTEDLLGQKQYNQFLRDIGYMKDEMITLADGSNRVITSFDDNIDILGKFGSKVKTLKENELENFKKFFTNELVDIQKSMKNLNQDDLLYQTQQTKAEDYQKALALVNEELGKYAQIRNQVSGEGGGLLDGDGALNALDLANAQQILAIKQFYADKENLQAESNARLLAAELAFLQAKAALEPDETKRLQIQSQILDKQAAYNKALKEAIPEIINTDDAIQKFNIRTLEQAKLMDYAAAKQARGIQMTEDYRNKQMQQIQTVQMVGSTITDYVSGAINGSLGEYATFGDAMILMSLQILKQMVPIWSAQILGFSLASPESVLTWGAAGMAKYAAITGILYTAISGVEAMVQKGIDKRRDSAQKTTQYASGKYPVVGASDGRTYNASLAGRPRTGLYSGPQLGLFNEDPSNPELVVDGKTTTALRVDYPQVYRGIRQLAAGYAPQFADGKYPDSGTTFVSQSDPEMKALYKQLLHRLDNPVAPEIPMYGRNGLRDKLSRADKTISKVSRQKS